MMSKFAKKNMAGMVLGMGLFCLLAFSARGEDAAKRVGIVDVSRIFQEYRKVSDVQENMAKKYDAKRKKFDKDEGDLHAREESIKMEKETSNPSDRNFFLKVQKFQMDKFDFESNFAALAQEVEKERTEEMKKVLNDIKAAIRFVGKQENLDLVLRAPEADNEFDPAKADKDKEEPKSASELVRKFRENPVMYYALNIDVTRNVIDKLNNDYKPSAAPVAPAVTPTK